jgi:predicted Zn finger-like uncharacterized protein
MDVACQHCPSVYPISEQKLAGRLVRFRCKSCGNPIVVDGRQNPSRPPVAITSVPPLSLANIASSVAPQPTGYRTAPLGGAPAPQNPSATPYSEDFSAPPAPPSANLDPGQVPRLSPWPRAVADKPNVAPPPFPNPPGINPQSRSPLSKPQNTNPAAAGSSPSAPRVAPSEPPPPFRAASQPHNPNPQDVDPSVYEDETVAMTAMELEAAADAQSPGAQSEPQHSIWGAVPAHGNPVATVLAAPAPASFAPPPLPTWNQALLSGNPSIGNLDGMAVSGIQTSFNEDPTAATSGPASFEYDPMSNSPKPTRAESWSIGKNSTASNPFAQQDWRQPTPAPASGRTLASAEPPSQDNPWLFRGLLVVLGIGGVVLGGVLGNTWLRHVLPSPPPQAGANASPAQIMNPDLPGFDALGANERLEAAQAEAVNCLSADTAPLTGLLIARFRPTGALDALNLTGSVGTAPEAPCIRSVFDKVTVPPFRGVTSQVEKALELRPRP